MAVALLGGCQSVPTRDPNFAPVRPSYTSAVPGTNNGAIYQAGVDVVPIHLDLFSDVRARHVGDILTIRLVEKTQASKKNESTVEQTTGVAIANPTLFGGLPSFRLPGRDTDSTLEQRLNANKDFEGKGDASQSNSLSGEITVTVAEVLPNGNLAVQGEKILTLNRGHEHIRFSGIVRPIDIAPDNSILSSKVANATIVYSGEGEVANASVMGWITRFFISALMPF